MIYLDNSATTNPKPQSVKRAVCAAVERYSFNSGRGGYKESVETSKMIYSAREKIALFFGFDAENIAFTPNCTAALNMAIKGVMGNSGHIIISNLEHNAASRPVFALSKSSKIKYDTAKFSFDAEETVNNFKKLIRADTKAVLCMHASNVFGCVFPIREIGKLARENGLVFIVDAAQSAGVLDINAEKDNIDILCAPGHKGLYGPVGTGFIAVRNGLPLKTIIEGGTGSDSMRLEQPDYMPDMLESGTLNNVGIAGLLAGVDFVKRKSPLRIYEHENMLMSYIYDELKKLENIILYTPSFSSVYLAPLLSFNLGDYHSEKTAALLADKNIAVRAGYHCSKLAHTAFKTTERGTVRISPCAFTTERDCEIFINTIKKL